MNYQRIYDAIKRTSIANKGRKNTIESNKRISDSIIGKHKGLKNPNFGKYNTDSPNYGRRWFHNKIGERVYKNPDEVDHNIWIFGMK
jgi:hypothetical protein